MKKTSDLVAEANVRIESLDVAGMDKEQADGEADVAGTAERTTSQKFLKLLAARDFERLATTLARDAHARLLLPYGLEEDTGRDAIVRRIESWFGSASVFDLTSSSEEAVGLRHCLSWRFSVVRDGGVFWQRWQPRLCLGSALPTSPRLMSLQQSSPEWSSSIRSR